MRISLNELKGALRKYFEAKYYYLGNIEDATNIIMWLEQHGLDGLIEFENSIPYLDLDNDRPLSSIMYEDHFLAIIDCHSRSALNCISASVDFAQAKAMDSGMSTIILKHCHNRKFILKALSDVGRRGVSMSAYWKNYGERSYESVASIKAGSQYPTFSSTELSNKSYIPDNQEIIISCSQHIDLRYDCRPTALPIEVVNSKAMRLSSENIIKSGVEIKIALWEHINEIASLVLVEESLQSQLGAGA